MNDKRAEINAILGTEPTHRHGRRWSLIGMVVVLLVALLAMGIGRSGNDVVHYRTQPVSRGDLTVTVTATGNLAPTNQVDVGSELSGIVQSVDVDYNDQVEVGQVLARLDTTKLKAVTQQMKAALASAEARVLQTEASAREARSQYQRLRRAGATVTTPQDLETAAANQQRTAADVAMAKAAVAQARATLETQQADLEKTVIRSPVSGIVLARNVEPGQTVAASLQAPVLFTLAQDLTRMELHVDVDEADVGQVHPGQPATFTVDAWPNRTFPARISQVRYGSKTVDGVVTYETLLEVDNRDLSLRPGMTATAEIVVQQIHDALLVPSAALRFAPAKTAEPTRSGGLFGAMFRRRRTPPAENQNGKVKESQRVWALRNGKPVAIPVQTGASDGAHTEITGGNLGAGTPLIIGTATPQS